MFINNLFLIGFFNVATGKVFPFLNPTRKEHDFATAIEQQLTLAPSAGWIFICDGLNIHKSETLVRLAARECCYCNKHDSNNYQKVLHDKYSFGYYDLLHLHPRSQLLFICKCMRLQ